MLVLDNWKALADFCRRLRIEDGKSVTELAAVLGVDRQQISNAESTSESAAPRMAARRRILTHYGYEVTEGFIVTGGSRPPTP